MGESANNPKWAQRSGPFRERRSKGAQEGWPEGRPEGADFASTRAAFFLRSFGDPIPRMGRRECAVQAFCRRQNLGAGGIDFRRAFQNSGSPAWQFARLGAQEVRPQGRPPRAAVLQALILPPVFSICKLPPRCMAGAFLSLRNPTADPERAHRLQAGTTLCRRLIAQSKCG